MSARRLLILAEGNSADAHFGKTARGVIRYRPEEVELEISDDGRGLVDGRNGGHGLVGMRERAALFGGTLTAGPLRIEDRDHLLGRVADDPSGRLAVMGIARAALSEDQVSLHSRD